MNLKSFFILVVAALLFSACQSSITESPSTITKNATLVYAGGLNVNFNNDIEEFNKSVRVISQANDSYILDIQFNVRTLNEVQSQQATVQFDISFTSEDGIFPVGNYILTSEQIKAAVGSYELNKINGDFARYNFQGKSATLVVEESNTKYIKGSLILNLEQLSGERMIDGQLENVILNSPIRLLSRFDLKY